VPTSTRQRARSLHPGFGDRIDRARVLVQNENAQTSQHGAHETHHLALAQRQAPLFLADLRQKPLGQIVDDVG
jgi:hypothetical protein